MGKIKKIVIIGGGPAGLAAAYELSKDKRYQVTVIEKDSQVGGISKTVNFNGNCIDLGGHRFFSKSSVVNDFWCYFLPLQNEQSNNNANSDDVMLVRNRISRIFAFGKFFSYPITIEPITFINLGLGRTLRSAVSYFLAMFYRKKCNTLEDFYIKRFGKTLYRLFFEKYTEKVWGKHPRYISPSWGDQRIKSLSIMKVCSEALRKIFNKRYKTDTTSLIDTFWYPKYGLGQLYEKIAAEVIKNGGEVILNSRVASITLDDTQESIKDITYKNNGGEITKIECDALFSSMPISELISLLPASKEITEISNNLPYRDFIIVGVLLKKDPSKSKIAAFPDNWIYVQDDTLSLGRIQIFSNWSPYLLRDPEHTTLVGLEYFCSEGDALWSMNDKDFIQYAIKELVKLDFIDETQVLDTTMIRVEKAYPAYFGVYEYFGDIKDYLNTISNLYCIGRNGQHKYNNMDDSILTALEGVKLLKLGSSDKTSLWEEQVKESLN